MTSCAGLLRLFAAAGACSQEVTFVVQDDKPVGLDGVQVGFDDERVVSDSGVMLVATLAQRLGTDAWAGELVTVRPGRSGAANVKGRVGSVFFVIVVGVDSID